MTPRYVLWGIPEGKTIQLDERVLLSEATSDECDQIEHVASADGYHDFRRTVLDDSPPDFVATFNL